MLIPQIVVVGVRVALACDAKKKGKPFVSYGA